MTYQPKSRFLKTVSERGFVHQCTDMEGLDDLLYTSEQAKKPVVAYIGFDCTAPSLHIGSLIQIMMLYWWQQAGHKPIVLMGGGTTKVGDPSGKDASRQLLDDAAIEKNMEGIKQVFSKFLGHFEEEFNENTPAAYMVNNDEWLSGLNYIDFLRDYGRFFSVNEMLTRDSVKLRLDRQQHLSFLEFNYMVLQGYDFVELANRYACRVQMGGSDQWGNILSGVDLFRKWKTERRLEKFSKIEDPEKRARLAAKEIKFSIGNTTEEVTSDIEQKQAAWNQKFACFGLTTPLLTTASGTKMGKTANGAIWLNKNLTSSFEYYQFWRNVDDADVDKFQKLFFPKTENLSLPEDDINKKKSWLAKVLVSWHHDIDAYAESALNNKELGNLEFIPDEKTLTRIEIGDEIPAFKLFVLAGLAKSNNEARRLIQGGGAKIRGETITDENYTLSGSHFEAGVMLLSAGKKRHVLVKII